MPALPFNHPVITAFQSAIQTNWGTQAPKVVRRTNNHWVVVGDGCESKPFTLNDLKRMTRAISAGGGQQARG